MPSREIVISPSALGPTGQKERIRPLKIVLLQGDLITQDVDAIVNAADEALSAGGGVDGQIRRAAGIGLDEECATLNGCKTGDAKITKGYKLNARHVIHAVGPIYPRDPKDDSLSPLYRRYANADAEEKNEIMTQYSDECHKAARLLKDCYRSILRVARENKLKSIAIPAISTGIFHYPPVEAAFIAYVTVLKDLKKNGSGDLEEIRFVLLDEEKYRIYNRVFSSPYVSMDDLDID